jgi:hypothetical protein
MGVPTWGFQCEADVHHPEVVAVAPGAASGVLSPGEISVLFGLELRLAGPVLEDVERLFLRDRDERGRRPRSELLGRGDLGRLVERDVPVLHGRAQVVGFRHRLGGRDDGLGLARRHARHACDVRRVVDLARERRDAECGELLGARIRLEQAACGLATQELGFEVGIGLLEKLDGLIDKRITHTSDSDAEV